MRVLITGSAKRIGAAVAEYLAAQGHGVIIHYHTSEAEAVALRDRLPHPGRHELFQADLTAPEAPARLIQAFKDNPPDVLVNNASSYSRRPLAEASPEVMREALDINFLVPFELMRCFHNEYHKGHIINILDHRIDHPDAKSGAYGFAKKSLRDATLACALEWAPECRVNAIAPAFVLPADGVPLERMQRLVDASPSKVRPTPQDIARTIDFLMSTPCINGQIIYLDAALHLLDPYFVQEKSRT